jgi:hypothetical protein
MTSDVKTTTTLTEAHKANFTTLVHAVRSGDVALMECQLVSTGNPVPVICAVNHLATGEIEFVPFAVLFDGNPYRAINPPKPEGGFWNQEEVWN